MLYYFVDCCKTCQTQHGCPSLCCVMNYQSVGFEPTSPQIGLPDYKSGAIDHSANSPIIYVQEQCQLFRSDKMACEFEPASF